MAQTNNYFCLNKLNGILYMFALVIRKFSSSNGIFTQPALCLIRESVDIKLDYLLCGIHRPRCVKCPNMPVCVCMLSTAAADPAKSWRPLAPMWMARG